MSGATRRRSPVLAAVVAAVTLLAGCSFGTAQPATDVTHDGATLHGYVAGNSSGTSTYWFEYGTSAAWGSPGHVQTASATVNAGDGKPHFVQQTVTGLQPETTYHFRLCARDTVGQPGAPCNEPQQFTTGAAPPPTELSVGTRPELYPQFDPQTSDYVTRCGGAPVQVDIAAPPDTVVAVDGGPARSGRFSESVAVSEGQRFEVSTTTGGSTRTHHVRCLPAAFPDWTYSRTGPPVEEWTLTAILVDPFGATLSDRRYVAFFDGAGVPVWWYRPAGVLPFDAKVVSGDVAFAEWNGRAFSADPSLKYQIRGLDGSLKRTLQAVGVPTDFHELQLLSNGNYLITGYRPRDGVDLSAYGKSSDATVLDAEVQEITPEGSLVWTWNSEQHIGRDETGRWWNTLSTSPLPDGRQAYDHLHINSVEADGDGLLLSMRHTDSVYRIERSNGQIDWKLGGTATPESLTIVDDRAPPATLGAQHDARRAANGTVTVHDNATGLGRAPRAVAYAVDTTARTATLVEAVEDPDFPQSLCCGSARRLDAGGWLVGWGNIGSPMVGRYAADGSRTSRLTAPGGFLYRAVPVPSSEVGAAALRQGMDAMFPR